MPASRSGSHAPTASVRLTVPTCIGCGAMGRPGSCPGGCREQRLDLVRAGAHDELVAVRDRSRINAAAFRAFAVEVAARQPDASELEHAYRAVQEQARDLLRRHPELPGQDGLLSEAAEPATTWWCEECGGLDAPQDCLGICIWRPIEWVRDSDYQRAREHALASRAIEARLRAMLRRCSSVTPRTGQWERCWHALQRDARNVLDRC